MQQSYAHLLFEFADSPAHLGSLYSKATPGRGEALAFDDLCK
jgi:hypothetical protein